MAVVILVTGLALVLVHRNFQEEATQSANDDFQARLGFLLGSAEARRLAVSQRCASLARSVRIRAALEEDLVDELYLNARIELREVLASKETEDRSKDLRAVFFRFLNARGEVLREPGTVAEEWETQIRPPSPSHSYQQVGFVEATLPGAQPAVFEVVTTAMFDTDGQIVGALVLGFPTLKFTTKSASHELKSGIWTRGHLFMSEAGGVDQKALNTAITHLVRQNTAASGSFQVEVGGEPNLLFYKILNPGSSYAPAYSFSLYSLSESVTQRTLLSWNIVGLAVVMLLGGLVASHFFATGLARPMEKLFQDSEKNLARREEAEAALVLTERKYQSIFENAVEGIFLLGADGRYLSANPALARIYGYESPEELIEKLTDPAQQLHVLPGEREAWLRLVESDEMVSGYEMEIRRTNGEQIWVSLNARCVRDETGSVLQIEGTVEDITERRQSANALGSLNAELQVALKDLKNTQQTVIQQERLSALGQMASGIAHDFNNALMPIMGYTDLLMEVPGLLEDTEKSRTYLDIIRTGAKDASAVVSRLREFYRSNEHKEIFAPVDLQHLTQQVVALTRPKWKDQAQSRGADVKIVTQLNAVPTIAGDEAALREVFTNLIFNAVDAMPDGGKITLRTRHEDGRSYVEVADSGTGMTPEVRARCLEPFFSTKGERGTGLGLSMVFGIVQRHDGLIDIQSEVGKGTTFILSFPVKRMSFLTEEVSEKIQTPRHLHILSVEDEPEIRELISEFLQSEGHTVDTACNGLEGVSRFENGRYDLVLTDRAMPGMNGNQLAAAIKKRSPKTPIVLISGFNSAAENEQIPCVDIVAGKPITMAALRNIISQAMMLVL